MLNLFAGEVAYRGAYTGALADQIQKADGKTDVRSMHSEAVREMERNHGSQQTAMEANTLKRYLVLPGPKRWYYLQIRHRRTIQIDSWRSNN